MPPAAGYMIYVLIDPRDRVPFYVGMTCRPGLRWGGHNGDPASSAYPRMRELRQLNLKCRVRIAAMNLSLTEAREREAALIREHEQTLLNGGRRVRRAA